MAIILAFTVGMKYGIDLAYSLYKTPFETEIYVQALENQLTLEHIDKNQIKEGHQAVALKLDGNILGINTLISEVNDEDLKRKMASLLRRIAKHREEFPTYYFAGESKNPNLKEANIKVAEILTEYKEKQLTRH